MDLEDPVNLKGIKSLMEGLAQAQARDGRGGLAGARDGRGGMGKKRSPGGSVDSSGLSG